MESSTVSSKYQIVIPSGIRKQLGIKPGNQFWIIYESNYIKLIPKYDIDQLFGTLKGVDSNIERDEEDRI